MGKVNDSSTAWIFDVCRSDVPFVGDCPVEGDGAGRYFADNELRKDLLDESECLSNTVASETSTDRVERLSK